MTTAGLDGAAAAGGVQATAEDVGRFLDALFEGRLVEPDSVAEMAAVQRTSVNVECAPLIGHLGSLPGFTTNAWRRVDGTRTVVVLINDEASWDEVTRVLSAAVCD